VILSILLQLLFLMDSGQLGQDKKPALWIAQHKDKIACS
jgi:hypothetical protein